MITPAIEPGIATPKTGSFMSRRISASGMPSKPAACMA